MILAVDVLEILDGIRSEVVASKLAAFSALASMLAALFAGIVLLRLAHDYVSGQGITFWELVRPFVLVLVVAQFNTFVASPLHRIVNIGTKGMSKQVNMSMGAYYKRLGNLCTQTYINASGGIKTTIGDATSGVGDAIDSGKSSPNALVRFGSKVASAIGDAASTTVSAIVDVVLWPLKKLVELLYSTALAVAKYAGMDIKDDDITVMMHFPLISLITLLLTFFLRIMIFALQVECYVTLALLTLFGPFTFALSIFNSWRGQMVSWIARYISVALWIPIQQILIYISYFLLGRIADIELDFSSSAPWLSLCCIVVTLQMLKRVPEISSYVVEAAVSGGTTDVLAPAKGLAAAGAKAGRAAMG